MSKFIELEVNGFQMVINKDQIEYIEPSKLGSQIVCAIYFKSKNPITGYISGTTTETYLDVKAKLLYDNNNKLSSRSPV